MAVRPSAITTRRNAIAAVMVIGTPRGLVGSGKGAVYRNVPGQHTVAAQTLRVRALCSARGRTLCPSRERPANGFRAVLGFPVWPAACKYTGPGAEGRSTNLVEVHR